MEFLELLETYRAGEAQAERIYAGEGERVRSPRRNDPRYISALAEFATFMADVYAGRVPFYRLQETMTTSDFPLMYGDLLDRQLLAAYQEWTPAWAGFARAGTVRDFRTNRRYQLDGVDHSLEAVVEQAEYETAKLDESKYDFTVTKYGRIVPISWEAWLNDDLDMFRDLPERLARSARRTEDRFAAGLIADTSGPHASFFTAGNANIVNQANKAQTNNPPLSIAGLQDGFTVLSQMTDAGGEPIMIDAAVLMVPPALRVVAQNIMNATQIEVGLVGQGAAAAPAAEQRLITANWIRNNLRVVVNPYLPVISTTNGNTSWYLLADPAVGPAAIEVARLRGHEVPDVFLKRGDAELVRGNDPFGTFTNDSIYYKVRHVVGGTRLNPKMAVASNGTSA